MKALTVRQPWAGAIICGFKDVENRTRQPPATMLGQRFAVHAGLAVDTDAEDFTPMRDFLATEHGNGDCHLGAVIGYARVCGWWDAAKGQEVGPPGTRQRVEASPWYMGGVGILIDGVEALDEPIDAKGQLGWWTI